MGLVGFASELVVIGCIAAGLGCTAYVVSTCDMLVLGRGAGKIGPWRADIRFVTDGCEGWDKSDSDDKLINMGRACSMMALVFGCIFGWFFLIKQCLCRLTMGQRLMDVSSTCVNVFLALIWFMVGSDVCDEFGCSWGSGATALMCAHFFYLGASIFSRCMREPRYERRRNEPPPQRHQSEPHQKVEKMKAGEEPKEKKGWFGWGGNQNAEESDNERVYVEDSEQEEADAGMEAGQSSGTKNVTASL